MPNNNNDKKLIIYVSLSIIIHLLVLYFLPLGFLHGSSQTESELEDYGYVQIVDYQPQELEAEEDVDNKVEENKVEPKKDSEIEALPEDEKETELEPTKTEKDPEVEIKTEKDLTEKEIKPESETNVKTDSETEAEDKDLAKNKNSELKPESETKPEAEPEPEIEEQNSEPEKAKKEADLMASEKSESEIEVKVEENKVEDKVINEVDENSNSEKEKTTSEPENIEEANSEPESETKSKAEPETKVSEKKPDPKPPTAGDLIGLIEPPAFPKDLVGSRSEGTVDLMVELAANGSVQEVKVIESSGYDSMDRVAQLTLKHGWEFKEYQKAYKIKVSIKYYVDQADNTQVDVNIGQVEFMAGGE